MKFVQINAVCGTGSTGRICISISRLLSERNIENYILYSYGKSSYPLGIKYSSDIYIKMQAIKSRIFSNYGFSAKLAARRLIAELERIKPDIILLHNIHGHDFDIEIVFSYLKTKKIKLYWTFHDCWAFTAYCPHFTFVKCDKWEKECEKCPQIRQFSFLFDRSAHIYAKKKELFSGLDLKIITPSYWLASIVEKSFFKDYPIKTIHNGIDLDTFKITESDFRQKHNLGEKFILLGVANYWDKRKGLDVFARLAATLDDRYKIVLVGVDSKTAKTLPQNILAISRTNNTKELAEIYTAADLFVNPTREEVFGLVNVEALACGTPVITFNTGGSVETICDDCGSVVQCDDFESLHEEIDRVYNTRPFSTDACVSRAGEFDMKCRYSEYLTFILS